MAAVFPYTEMDALLVLLLLRPPILPVASSVSRHMLFRHNIVPLFHLVIARFLVSMGPHLRHFSESNCASALLDASVSGILASPGGLRRCSPVVDIGPSRLAELTFITQDPECTERSR